MPIRLHGANQGPQDSLEDVGPSDHPLDISDCLVRETGGLMGFIVNGSDNAHSFPPSAKKESS